ncbi:MAG: Gfo/Idh/MocA family oxidoreductase [Solobacterium sp.]|nr:Gfo/Idh/MocA family oxidoreductase [Solobacterium sp.]
MKLGIIGNGMIVQTALRSLEGSDIPVKALWCRNAAKGQPLCGQYSIEKLYTDFDGFLEDDSFDTVYVGLINSLHYEYAKKALLAGKNVICEKPLTSTYEEAEELVRIAEGKKLYLFEAIMSRYSRNYECLPEAVKQTGEMKVILCNYSQYSRRYDDYAAGKVLPAFDPALSGGALYDINVYNVHFVTGLFGRPQKVVYEANKGFNGIDTSGVLVLDYGTFKAVCTGAKDCSSVNGIILEGTKGWIRMDSRPGMIRSLTLHTPEGETVLDVCEEPDPMRTEFEKIASVLQNADYEKMRAWLEQSLITMEVLTEARKYAGIRFPADA